MQLVTAAVAVAAVTVTLLVLRHQQTAATDVVVPWWGIALGYFLASILVAHITIRNHAYTLTLSEVPMVVGLAAASPSALVIGGLTGTALALVLYRRQPPLKLVFNVATFLVEADVAIVVMQALLGGHPVNSGIGWLATLAGTLTSSVLGQAMVIIVMLASVGVRAMSQMVRTLAFMSPVAVLNTVFGLAGLHVLGRDPQFAALLLIPCVALAAAYRSYLAERRRHGQVRQLYEASGALHRSRGVDASITTLLRHARDMFNAEVAELTLLPANAVGPSRRFTLGPGETPVETVATDSHAMHERAATPKTLLLDRAELTERGLRDGIITSISAEPGVRGILLIANRRDTVSSFDRADVALLEAFAGPVSVSLENGRLHAELEHQAFHDSLTGLPNRALLARRIDTALAQGHRRGAFAVLLLDIDDFKAVNDALGHPTGDQLLIKIADRLSTCVGAEDMVARLGGDEFAILLRSAPTPDDAAATAERVLEAMRQPFNVAAWDITVRCSIGVVIESSSATTVDDLISRADIAMYRAKGLGKDRWILFEPLMHAEVMARHQLRADLERAMAHEQLSVHYQPIVALETGEVSGAEALVRWTHPIHGSIPPDEFIALAEDSGLIVPLGRFVLDEACRQLVAWQRPLPRLQLSVNVSVRQLQQPTFVDEVAEICGRHNLDLTRVTLEVTERVMLNDPRALGALEELRSLGVRIAIDDFGTGYSSLSCLSDLPIDTLKIAKPFVDRIARGDVDRAVVTSVVSLARSLRLDTVAEGIERPDQARVLLRSGCRAGQGFLFSRALPAADFLARVGTPAATTSLLAVAS